MKKKPSTPVKTKSPIEKSASPKTAKTPAAKKTAAANKKAVAKKAASKKKGRKKEDLMCFLTSACVDHYGMADNCHELQTLRQFRDNTLLHNDVSKKLVEEYYRTAPIIVSQLKQDPESERSYRMILDSVRQTCSAIVSGEAEQAIRVYRRMFLALRSRYL